MKSLKRILLTVLALLGIFVIYTLSSSGFFRKIEPVLDGEIIKKIPIKGAEDIMVSLQDSFALISSTDRANNSIDTREGGLYYLDLKSDDFSPTLISADLDFDFFPHGISYYKSDSIYHLAVINHTKLGHSIELFELQQNKLKHKRTLRDESMIRPNDLVMLNENQLYFTNDHGYTEGFGKVCEEYLGLGLSNVTYFDGENFNIEADKIAYANGINYDANRNLMFVASLRNFSLNVFSKNEDGSLSFIEEIPCKTGVDNIEFDKEMNLWIGCHPSLMTINAYMAGKKEIAPSEVIKINYRKKGDFDIEKIYVEDGSKMSGSSVAAPFNDLIFVGNVQDDHFLVIKSN